MVRLYPKTISIALRSLGLGPQGLQRFQRQLIHGFPHGGCPLLHRPVAADEFLTGRGDGGFWIDPGKTGKASIDTLCGYVWPSEASGSTMRKRRQRVREALPELVALGWTVTEFAAGKYDITRPKAAG